MLVVLISIVLNGCAHKVDITSEEGKPLMIVMDVNIRMVGTEAER